MTLKFHIWLLVNGVVAIASLASAILLYRFCSLRRERSLPSASILIIVITGLITGLQFVFPEILTSMRRNPEALRAGEWWRMITPLFVQALGWKQCCLNGVAAVIFCPLVERLYGKRLLVLYFVPGVLGEIFGYAWGPYGAGSSLGIVGTVGGLFAFSFLHRREIPGRARIFSILGFVGALALCFYGDNHGPPILIGALVASLMTVFWPNKAPLPTATVRGISAVTGNITSPTSASGNVSASSDK